jgi:hypothetical protein
MGEVIRPWQFWATHYATFQIAHKRAKDRGEATLRPESLQAAMEELQAWLRMQRRTDSESMRR